MKRSPLVRKTPLRSRQEGPALDKGEHPRAKEPKPAKERECICGAKFAPKRMEHVVCSPRCLIRRRKEDAKAERESFKARKEAIKTIPELLAKAQDAVNKYCRLKDMRAGKSCISCGAKPAPKFGGSMDAGHYRSVGSAGHLRFFTPQIRLQCVRCNRDLAGNVVEYRKALVAEHGEPWVKWLESLWWVEKWNRDYLSRLARIARRKTRRLEKRMNG